MILQRCHSGFVLKHPAEIGLAAEAASAADLPNGQFRVFQHIFCRNNAGHENVVHDRQTGGLLKFLAEIVFAHMKHRANLIHGQMLVNVRIDIFRCFLHHAENRKHGVGSILIEQDQKLNIMAGYKCIMVIFPVRKQCKIIKDPIDLPHRLRRNLCVYQRIGRKTLFHPQHIRKQIQNPIQFGIGQKNLASVVFFRKVRQRIVKPIGAHKAQTTRCKRIVLLPIHYASAAGMNEHDHIPVQRVPGVVAVVKARMMYPHIFVHGITP